MADVGVCTVDIWAQHCVHIDSTALTVAREENSLDAERVNFQMDFGFKC